MKKLKSIRQYMTIGTLACSIGGFVIFTIAGFYFFKQISEDRSREIANNLSNQTFNSMYQVMKKGWSREDLEEFITATKKSYKNSSTKINIYRSPVVEELYGTIGQNPDKRVQEVFKNGNIYTSDNDNHLTFVYPIRANNECLTCHTNIKPGAIMGAIEVSQNTGRLLDATKKEFIYVMLLLLPFPIVISFLIGTFMIKPIKASVKHLEKKISDVNSIKDLSALETDDFKTGLKEFDAMIEELKKLAKKLKNIAADRDLLEFEVRLLDKFIITSDVVKDWKEHIKDLLIEINAIMHAYSLFVVFKLEEESYDVEIFWVSEPSEKSKNMFEEIVRQRVKDNPYFDDFVHLEMNHHPARPSSEKLELSREDIELQTKSLILATPKIGGIVGIGVQSTLNQDPTRYIVIESILTTLINVIGSVKAIYKYTKDLEYYATRDPLTNMYNQRVFRELLGYEIGRATRHGYKFGVIVIDFDNFKLINDKYGHDFGDKFLIKFSSGIAEAIRQEDIVARYGGDEFVIIVPNSDSEQAYHISEKIQERIRSITMTAPNGDTAKASVSIGFSIFPDHGKNIEELFIVADNMMYKAKKEGKDRIGVPTDEDIIDSFNKINQKIDLVLETIEKENLVPFFQPIKNIGTGEIQIHELLMRIEQDGRYIPAYEFIETAETLGVIHKMDYILIDKALKKAKEAGYTGYIFINMSPKALIISEFISKIKELAKKHAFDTSKLVVEITERDSVKNLALLEKFVYDLKMEGFKFAIDDFGSGFSSFHYIKRLPIDFIKIEGEFIRNIAKDDTNRAFARSIVTLAKELNIQTVAEFVEDESVMEEIMKLDIDYAQGYYIGKPNSELLLADKDESTLDIT